MNLSTKLIGGFCVVAAITCIVGTVGWVNVTTISRDIQNVNEKIIPLEQGIARLLKANESLRVAVRTLMNPYLSQEIKKQQYTHFENYRKEIEKTFQDLTAIPEKSKEIEDLLAQIQIKQREYLAVSEKFVALSKEGDALGILNPLAFKRDIERFKGLHYLTLVKVFNLINFKEEFEGGDDASQCEFGKWLADFKTENENLRATIDAIKPNHEAFHAAVKRIKEAVKGGDTASAMMIYKMDAKPSADKTFEQFDQILELAAKNEKLHEEMVTLGMENLRGKQQELFALLNKISEAEKSNLNKDIEDSQHNVKIARIVMATGMALGVVLALAIGIYIAFTTSRTIRRIANGLSEGADQVVSASSQVSSSSQNLAEMTSQQAAAVEETSSALEEMASMTRQNADSALEANKLMEETKGIVSEARSSMEELATSMTEINRASEETFKIIKTIDEIAFQTNLLALNAAVEAARAGEAGAGFAVVADEVRSLAMRAAEAAKNTAVLIETTVNKVKQGTAITDRTKGVFLKVAESSEKVSELLGEIAAASEEQRQGIDQLNRAVSDLDRSIQNNAANAEESASAAEELNAQASELRSYVKELLVIVGGAKDARVGKTEVVRKEGYRALKSDLPLHNPKGIETSSAKPIKKIGFLEAKSALPKKKEAVAVPSERTMRVKPLMVWSKEYEVGVPEIDEQHQRLFKMINDLNEAMTLGRGKDVLDRILTGLVDYTARHFKTEEMYMDKAGYPELDSHREVHVRLTDKVHEMVDRYKTGEVGLGIELLNFLQDWLKKHILGTDKKYAPYLAGLDLRDAMF